MSSSCHARRILVVLVLFALSAGLLSLSASATTASLAGKIVALDPGHFETATDTGAINSRVTPTLVERDVNWEVVLATKSKLEAFGTTVVLTRQEGQYLDRPTRYAIANAAAPIQP
jgi:N-acetylmuramoyl-L-alanine amidase